MRRVMPTEYETDNSGLCSHRAPGSPSLGAHWEKLLMCVCVCALLRRVVAYVDGGDYSGWQQCATLADGAFS